MGCVSGFYEAWIGTLRVGLVLVVRSFGLLMVAGKG